MLFTMENYCRFTHKLLTVKTHLQIKTQALTKSMNINIGNSYIEPH